MSKAWRITIFAMGWVVLCVLAWKVPFRHDRMHQGKPESAWISSLTNSYATESDAHAWQTLGADGIALLLKVAEKREGPAHASYVKVWTTLPGFLQHWCPRPIERSWPRVHALNVLSELAKHNPVPMGPLVTALSDRDPQVRMGATSCLIVVASTAGPAKDKEELVSALVRAYQTNTNSATQWNPEAGVRNNVIIALGNCGDQREIVVPVLRKALLDPDNHVRSAATNALKRIDATATAQAGLN